ncbi:MAG: hypothetical protein Q7R81_04625 [Candidatus Peregrinibacteria bacterium]|nr:hypothetical protein [Candidatus Peregrinibacteria bacterium]
MLSNAPNPAPLLSSSAEIGPTLTPESFAASRVNHLTGAMQQNPVLGTATNMLKMAGGLIPIGLTLFTTLIGVRMIMGWRPGKG